MPIEIGCCLNMMAAAEDPTGIGFAQQAKELGFDYVELPMAQLMEYSNDGFAEILARFKDIGIPCRSCNNFLPAHMKVTGASVNRRVLNGYLEKALYRGYELGIETLVFGSGGARNLDDGTPAERGFEQLADFLCGLSDALNDSPVYVAIEPLNAKECNIINSLAESAALAKAVNRPNIGVLFDYYHMAMAHESVQVLEKLKKDNAMLVHSHIADPSPKRGFPLEKSRIADLTSVLKSIGYNNKLSIEGYTSDFMRDGAAGLKIIRELVS